MYEVELKIRAEHGPVRDRLEAMGADRAGRVRQADTYYDAPHRDFATTDEALRVRRVHPLADGDGKQAGPAGPDVRLTYKGPLVDEVSKTRQEHETGVADGEALAAALEALGFSPAATVEKRRERFTVRGYAVVLDEVTGLGRFVEVERAVPESEVDRAREGALDLLRDLGLDPEAGIRTSYLGMVLSAGDGDRDAAGDGASDGTGDGAPNAPE